MKVVKVTPHEVIKALEGLINENESLKQQNNLYNKFFESDIDIRKQLIKRIDDYKNRIDKAIKFINENKREIELDEYLLCDCLYDEKTIELLKILEGDNNE